MNLSHSGSSPIDLTLARPVVSGARPEDTLRTKARAILAVPLLVFAVSRGLYLALGQLAPHLLPSGPVSPVLPRHSLLGPAWSWTSTWFRFDTSWYVGVAQHGYHWGAIGVANTNFFPLYPLLVRVVEPLALGDIWLSAWLVANAAYLAALIYLWVWARRRWSQEVAVRFLILFAAFPFSLFFFVPYAEPVFLATAAAAFYYAEEDRWGPAVIAGALAVASRPVGIALVLALFMLALQRNRKKEAGMALLTAVPLVAFIAYLTLAFGHPLAFLTYHSAGWVAPKGGFLSTMAAQFHTNLSPFDRVDAAAAVLFLASGLLAWRKLGTPYAVYVLVGVLLPLIHGLVSMERYVTVLYPAVALWASRDNKAVQVGLFALSAAMLVVSSILFASGYSLF